jgi:uncharacterized protein (TIGR03435 family)
MIGLVQLPIAVGAQIASQSAPALHFDVVSLKIASDQNHFETIPERSPGRFNWTTQGFNLVEYAYGLQAWQISGDTAPLATVYQVEATTSPSATEDEERRMVQSLLLDRFEMVTHRSTKIADGYILAQGKSGPQMLEASGGDVPPLPDPLRTLCGNPPRVEDWVTAILTKKGATAIRGCRATMTHLSEELEQVLGITVLDRTKLEGRYYFAFEYATDADPSVPAPNLPDALSPLGLKLAKYKGPVQTLVIDHVEKTPIPN